MANAFGVTEADVAHLDAGMQAVVEFRFGVRRGVLRNVSEGRFGWSLGFNDRDPRVVLSDGQPGVYVVRVVEVASGRPDSSTGAPASRISSGDKPTRDRTES